MPSILLFGVTGLVGSHLVLTLKKKYPTFPVTVYLRNTDIDTYLYETAGVSRIVHGTYDEGQKISSLAEEHDIVINVGSSWDVGLSESIVEGLQKRERGKKTTLIHMSGTGNFVETRWEDGAHHEEAKIWDDSKVEDIELISPKMLNGGPDTVVLNAGKEGRIGTYMIFPPIMFGRSAGPIRALGVIQLLMHQKALELGFVPYVGPGTALTNSLHANSAVSFVLLILALSLKEQEPQWSAYERCYIIGGKETAWKDMASAFAQVFAENGIVKDAVPKSVTLEKAGEGEIPMLMARDMRFVGPRAAKLGYKNEDSGLENFIREGGDIFPV
jgi:nucleoside-diphosphate-sugar epimerase